MVVVRKGERTVGLLVDEVIDMAEFTDIKTELAQPARAIDGHLFVGDRTVALLDIAKLLGARTEEDQETAASLSNAA